MKVEVSGFDEFYKTMQEIAELPTEVQDEILNAEADIAVEAQKQKAEAMGIVDTHQMVESIKKTKPKVTKTGRAIYVYPHGNRTRGKKKMQSVRNAEIAFVTEYGARGKKPRQFIRTANEACAEQTTKAAEAVYDKWLKSKDI